MAKYLLRCRVCGELFESYIEHAEHIFSRHPEAVWARLKPEVVRVE